MLCPTLDSLFSPGTLFPSLNLHSTRLVTFVHLIELKWGLGCFELTKLVPRMGNLLLIYNIKNFSVFGPVNYQLHVVL